MRKLTQLLALVVGAAVLHVGSAWAQSSTFGGSAQHTANFPIAAQDLSAIRWTTSVDLNNTGGFAHYGAPLITPANSVFVPVKTATDGFQVNVFSGSNGAAKYALTTDYILPSHSWIPTYNPTLATGAFGTRLYYAGAGGTVYYIDNPDSVSHGAPVQVVFYTTLTNYQNNASSFNSTIFINTPLTPDANGNIYFGFRVQGTAPSPLNTTQSGFARITPAGAGTFVLAGTAATDANISRDSHNSAPALSNDGSTLYVVVKSAASSEDYGYLLGLDSTTLATKYRVFLKDPRNGNANNARILDNGTASPTVAPDGDVYMGVFGNPSNGSRGFLLRFTGDLTVEKAPGGFGWDYTPAIVPASMAPSYTGASPYLIFSKYNNYPFSDGDGLNKIALLDPNATQIDPHTSAGGLVEMREVLTITGPTPDAGAPANFPNAVREWCINTAAVNPATNSIFTPSEDGHIYRWNLATNSLSQAAALTQGIGEPYVPTVIGPDGIVYTLNGGTLFALGALNGVGVTVTSSKPDARTVVVGQSLTFSATVANTGGSAGTPTGNVTFSDLSFQGRTPVPTTLASVALDAGGHAGYSTAALSAGSHFITVTYGGDGIFSAGSATLMQQIHASASNTALSSSGSPSTPGQAVTFTATVTSAPSGGGTPTGMVTFQEGVNVLTQIPVNGSGVAAFSTSTLGAGSHTITAVYYSDGTFATSSGSVVQLVQTSNSTTSLTSSSNPSVSGQAVTFTAAVTVSSGTPTGSVTFKDGAITLGTGNLNAQARATFTTSALSVGPHSITAVYAGDGAFGGSTSTPLAQQVNKDSSTTILTSSLNPSTRGQVVTFNATVIANSPGSGIPSGTITFKDKNKVIGSAALDGTGRASLSTSTLAQGAHQITAVYAGNANFVTSTSAAVNQTVKK